MDANVQVAIITGAFGIITTILAWFLGKRNNQHEKTDAPKLANHHIFTRLEMLKNHIDVNFTLPNKGKEVLFKDMLLNNLSIWKLNLTELALKLDDMSENVDLVTFQNTILNHFEKGLNDFSNYYKTQGYTYDEQVSLDLVMAKFNRWNYPRINCFRDTLMIVCNSQFYLDYRIKSAVIMDMYISLFVDTMSDAESTIGEINGDLRGMVFKGITI